MELSPASAADAVGTIVVDIERFLWLSLEEMIVDWFNIAVDDVMLQTTRCLLLLNNDNARWLVSF
jgi:hypothetical protein